MKCPNCDSGNIFAFGIDRYYVFFQCDDCKEVFKADSGKVSVTH